MSTEVLGSFASKNMETSTETADKPPRTVNIFVGFFFVVNFCLGTGFLGVPYSYFYSGYLAAIPTLLVAGFVTWLTASWYVECMARAQALETYKQENSVSNSVGIKTAGRRSSDPMTVYSTRPKFEITVHRCFEPIEMCEIFFGSWLKYIYIVILSVYALFSNWSYCSVAGTAWASNIPYNFAGMDKCSPDAFHHHLLPNDRGCLKAYYFSLFLFGVVVVSLSMLDLKEQAVVQLFMGLLRFFTVGAILVYSIVKLSTGEDVCENKDIVTTNQSTSAFPAYNLTRFTSFEEIVVKFNPRAWPGAIPVLLFAFIIHQGIPSLTHPIKQKKHLRWLMMVMFGVAGACYLSLGIVVPLWFKSSTQETITLNFNKFTEEPGHSLALKVLSFYLIFFPFLNVMSAYPLTIHVIVNNFYDLIIDFARLLFGLVAGQKIKKHRLKYESLLKLAFRFFAAIIPLLLALSIANLVQILKFAGLFGFFMCLFFPATLQFQSIRVCKKKFGTKSLASSDRSFKQSAQNDHEKTPLIQVENPPRPASNVYMTPYSLGFLSHPVTVVCVVFGVGVCLFGLTLTSWFVKYDKMTCSPY